MAIVMLGLPLKRRVNLMLDEGRTGSNAFVKSNKVGLTRENKMGTKHYEYFRMFASA